MITETPTLTIIPDGPTLRAVALSVDSIRDDVLPHLREMRQLMRTACGIGLAAPQVGISRRFFITGLRNLALRTVINPTIIRASGSSAVAVEGCLSFPGVRKHVLRPASISCTFTDAAGTSHELVLHREDARVFQHELDHLNGICISP